MACIGVKCALNATCFATSSVTHLCRCNVGFEGNGYTTCKPQPFKEFSLMLVLCVVLFCVLVVILVSIVCRQRLQESKRKREPAKADPYNINWHDYFVQWRNTTVRTQGKVRQPLEQNGGNFKQKADNDNDVKVNGSPPLPFSVDDADIQRQKSKLRSSPSANSIRINVTEASNDEVTANGSDDGSIDGGETDSLSLGVDNLSFPFHQEVIESKYSTDHEVISLTSFKPTINETPISTTSTPNPNDQTPPEKPPPYSSKNSFKEVRRSPRIQPKITKKVGAGEKEQSIVGDGESVKNLQAP